MESTDTIAKLKDLILLTPMAVVNYNTAERIVLRCDCRNGGICQGSGDCLCPFQPAYPTRLPGASHLGHAFGWNTNTQKLGYAVAINPPQCNDAACEDVVVNGCPNGAILATFAHFLSACVYVCTHLR